MPSPKIALALSLLVCALSCSSETATTPMPPARDILLISIDTLRADALSSYGYPQPTTPNLDALAADGIRFADVMTQAANTATSHASLFTGVYPWTHRVSNVAQGGEGYHMLYNEFETLAESFGAEGYATASFTDGGPFLSGWKLLQGFEKRHDKFEGAPMKVKRMLDHLDKTKDETRPRFLFLHTYEVHEPYLPPVEFVERFNTNPGYAGIVRQAELTARKNAAANGGLSIRGRVLTQDFRDFDDADVRYLWDLYVAGVAYTDFCLGQLFDELKARGKFDDMLIIVTSDHGEEFGEHGKFGHYQLRRETLSVPLIMHLPADARDRYAGMVVDQRISQIDLHATLMEVVDRASPHSAGVSLWEGLEAGVFPERTSFAEVTEGFNFEGLPGYTFSSRSAYRGDRSVLLRQEPEGKFHHLYGPEVLAPGEKGAEALYSEGESLDGDALVRGDASQKLDLHARVEEVVLHLRDAVETRRQILVDPNLVRSTSLDDETRSELEALGYLDSEAPEE